MMHNERGDAFIIALILVGLISIVVADIFVLGMSVESQISKTRAKLQLAALDQETKHLLESPYSYSNCSSAIRRPGYAAAGSTCVIDSTVFARFSHVPAYGGICHVDAAHPTGCWFSVSAPVFDPVAMTASATVGMNGSIDFTLAPSKVSVAVPLEVLQSQSFSCPLSDASTPIFAGFAENGQPICKPFNSCGVGQYVVSVDAATSQPNCVDLPTPKVLGCDTTKMISSFQWMGGNATAIPSGCDDRLDPFLFFWGP